MPEVSGSGSDYTVTVTGMTGSGVVNARIPAAAALDGSGATTLASTSTDNAVMFDHVPAVTIDQGAAQSDPTNGTSITFDVHFSEAVTGFDPSDVLFTGNTVGGALAAAVSGASPGQDYTVTVTGMAGTGTVVAGVRPGAAANAVGTANTASTSTDNAVTFDGLAPTVTINQGAGQADPTGGAGIRFDVRFREPVTGFTTADVSLAGTTAGGTLSVDVTGSLDTYTVTVTGMTTRGSVAVTLPAGGATDAVGNASLASTSTDNTVEFLRTGTIGFARAVFGGDEDGPDQTITVRSQPTSPTEGPVSVDFAVTDGTAHSGSSSLPGQDDYTAPGDESRLTWADGEGGDKTFTITITRTTWNEGRELISLALQPRPAAPASGSTRLWRPSTRATGRRSSRRPRPRSPGSRTRTGTRRRSDWAGGRHRDCLPA